MHAHTNLEMSFSKDIEPELLAQIHQTVAEAASDENVELGESSLSFEESYRLVWLEDLVDAACKLARLCKGKTWFTMAGTIDTSESAGEYMDYNIEFQDDVLKVQNSCWYLMYCGTDDWDDSYEDFCEQFDKKEDAEQGKHTYSEEFFEKLREEGEWYSTNGFGCDLEIWLDGVHLDDFQEVPYDDV